MTLLQFAFGRLRPRLATAVVLLAAGLLQAAVAAPLLTSAELSIQLAGSRAPRIIDIRTDKTAYAAGHIAGSLPAPYSQWRGPQDNPGQLPTTGQLQSLIQSLGIDADTPVVVVYEGTDSSDFGAAARVYWTLKVAGVRNPAILNGGLKAWRAAKLPLASGAATSIARSTYTFTPDSRLIATRAEVRQAVDDHKAVLLDARPASFFKGEAKHPAATSPGTIAGARDLDNALWFGAGSGALPDSPLLAKIAQQNGIDATQPTVSFCNTGHWAATNWFVLSEVLGNPDVKLYPESMVEWSRAEGPMDNVPGRLQQFARQLSEATSPK